MKKIFKSEFVENFSVLLSGNVGGQAIALLVYPLLTRMYTQECFGTFALFSSIVSILAILATGKYEEAIIITPTKKEALCVTGYAFRILCIFSFLLTLILLFFKHPIFSIFDIPEIERYWYLIPVLVFFSGILFILIDLANKDKMYKAISASNVSLNLSSSALKLGFGCIALPDNIGLILATVISYIPAIFSFCRIKHDFISGLSMTWAEKKAAGKKYAEFPKYSMTRNLIYSFSTNIPFLMLIGVFGEAKLGLFALALTLGFRPINLITGSLYQVFYERIASKKNNNEKISYIIKNYWVKTTYLMAPMFILLYYFLPFLVSFIFGKEWAESSIYFRYLLPWIFFSLLLYPMLFLPAVFSKQSIALWLEIGCLLVRLCVVCISIYFKDFDLGILLYSLTGCLFAGISLIWYITLIKRYES